MPGTASSSSTLRKPPWASRQAMMRWAMAGPIRGRLCNCSAVAVLMLTGAEAAELPVPPEGVRVR